MKGSVRISYLTTLIFLGVVTLGCEDAKEESTADSEVEVNADRLPSDRSEARRALRVDFRWLEKTFPTFHWQASSELVTHLGQKKKDALSESYELTRDSRDIVHGRHENSKEYGFEFYWQDGTYHFHNRYRPLQHRQAGRATMRKEAQKIWATLGAYWRLVRRFVKLGKPSKTSVAGRTAYRYPLILRKKPRPFRQPHLPRRRWRRTIEVKKLSGRIALDANTGAPLKVALDATYTFQPPTAPPVEELGSGSEARPQGNPKKAKAPTARVELSYRHELAPSGPDEPLEIPDSIPAPVRKRSALDRRALLGNTPRPGWWRGGGPVRAWYGRRNRGRRKHYRRQRQRRRAQAARAARAARPESRAPASRKKAHRPSRTSPRARARTRARPRPAARPRSRPNR